VSNTLSEPIAAGGPPESFPLRRLRPWHGWLKWIALAVACLWLADTGLSLLIQQTALKRRLTSRLEVAFGRPVDVGHYSFSLWTGPELEAHSVRVAEDPRFGQEYFLRAESLTLRLRFWSLLAGHLRLGTISLSHPSLNLVRNQDGDWNLAEWLPRPENAAGPVAPSHDGRASKATPPFHEIDVDGGRINFKRGDEKLPFAFVGVNGTLETESPGLWRIDLVAAPMRAATIVEQPGVLHLVGHLGGTSSRLRPAVLEIDWTDASISDVLRLASDRDYGLRGSLGLSVAARTQGDSWLLKANALVTQLHRWNLPLRTDNPSFTVVATGRLDPSGSRIELTDAKIEAPHSNAKVTGAVDWTHPGPPFDDLHPQGSSAKSRERSRSQFSIALNVGPGTQLRVVSSAVSLRDLLDWARAFHPGIADGVSLGGVARLDANLDGWPPRLHDAAFDLPRGELIGSGIPAPVRLGSLLVRYDSNRGFTLAPATLAIGTSANSFRVEGSANPSLDAFSLRVRGSTSNVHDVVAAARQLGWNLARGWDIAGPVQCDLRWQGADFLWRAALAGSVEWGTALDGVSLGAPFLNLPVEQIRARADLKPGLTQMKLSSARAFGARWTGTLDHDLSGGWRFSVSGDSLSAADLDRWLDPRWRESFLDRMLPFLNPRAPANSALESMQASGHIALDDFTLGRVVVRRLRGDLKLDGRKLELTNAAAQFYRGQLAGVLKADLASTPKYETALDFSGVDLHALSAEFPSLAGLFSGSASAKIRFNLGGASRSDLLNSLECRGAATAEGFSAEKITLSDSAADPAPSQPGAAEPNSFGDASAAFTCTSGKILFQDLALSRQDAQWDGAGFIDFTRNLDLRLRSVPADSSEPRPAKLTDDADDEARPASPRTEYRITGALDSPRIARIAIPIRSSKERR
jgi:hypothetical protein